MNTDKKLQLIESGKMSDTLLNVFGDKIRETSLEHLARLKSNYKSGKSDQATLSSGVAAICALDDLLEKLTKDVRTGNKVSREIREDAHTRSDDPDTFPIA